MGLYAAIWISLFGVLFIDTVLGNACYQSNLYKLGVGQVRLEAPQSTVVTNNDNVCSTWGDSYFKTFDGYIFHNNGNCTYLFVKHCHVLNEDFKIYLQRNIVDNDLKITYIFIKLFFMAIEAKTNGIYVNNIKVEIPYKNTNLNIEYKGFDLAFEMQGISILWNQKDRLQVALPNKYKNQTCGLCGDFNGFKHYSEGFQYENEDSIDLFITNNLADIPDEICVYTSGNTSSTCNSTSDLCRNILQGPHFSDCVLHFDMNPYLEICESCDCIESDMQYNFCLCSILTEFSKQCALAKGKPENWRKPELCNIFCPPLMEYSECGTACAKTCSNQEIGVCTQNCVVGCFCPNDTVYDDVTDKGCIPPSECYCKYSGEAYSTGATISLPCENCTCSEGIWNCERTPCPGTCSVEGGSHITTFDRRQFRFHGDCSYILTQLCTNPLFSIHGEIKPCYHDDVETCLTKVMLTSQDLNRILIINRDGHVTLNSAEVNLPYDDEYLDCFNPTSFYIIVQTNFGLRLDIQLIPIMQVYIYLNNSYYGQTCGLCGNFNDKQFDDYETPNGMSVQDLGIFANSWRSDQTCKKVSTDIIDPCSIKIQKEPYAASLCSKLNLRNKEFAACHSVVNPSPYYEKCLYDTCLCMKSEDCLCAVFSSYIRACAERGINIKNWRQNMCDKYTHDCPDLMIYQEQISVCQPTCKSISKGYCDKSFTPIDGCVCRPGLYMTEHGKCIFKSQCPCYYLGHPLNPGEKLHINGIDCVCRNGEIECERGLQKTNCTSPMIFFNCSSEPKGSTGVECLNSCKTLHLNCEVSLGCVSGCMCPKDMFEDGKGGCVPRNKCPCFYNDYIFNDMERTRIGCEMCTCSNQTWVCEKTGTMAQCDVYGEGNYITFDNKQFRYSGQCEYTLVQDFCGSSVTSGTFRIISENVQCGTESCAKTIKMFLDGYILLLTDGDMELINEGDVLESPFKVRNISLYLVIEASNGIFLIWDKKTSITIKIPQALQNHVCGLCGNYDGNSVNDFTTRGHFTVQDVVEFGNSWKLESTCPEVQNLIEPCEISPHRKSWAQRECSIILSKLFKPCHSEVDPESYYDACVKDSCACDEGGDCNCFCTAIAVYAQACLSHCVCIEWRTPNRCPVFCDYYNHEEGHCEYHYKPCGVDCIKSCRNPKGICVAGLSKVEGCYPSCPSDKPYLEEVTMECVAECGCYDHMGKYYKLGDKIISCKNCEECECSTKGIKCAYNELNCYCEYNGVIYAFNQTVYNSTAGKGMCVEGVCGVNGSIKLLKYPCKTQRTSTTKSVTTVSKSTISTTPATSASTTICYCYFNNKTYLPGEIMFTTIKDNRNCTETYCAFPCEISSAPIPCTTPLTSTTQLSSTVTSTPRTKTSTSTGTTTTSTGTTTTTGTSTMLSTTTFTSTGTSTTETVSSTTTTATPSTTTKTTTTSKTTPTTSTATTTSTTPSTTTRTTTTSKTTTTGTGTSTTRTISPTTSTETPSTTTRTTTTSKTTPTTSTATTTSTTPSTTTKTTTTSKTTTTGTATTGTSTTRTISPTTRTETPSTTTRTTTTSKTTPTTRTATTTSTTPSTTTKTTTTSKTTTTGTATTGTSTTRTISPTTRTETPSTTTRTTTTSKTTPTTSTATTTSTTPSTTTKTTTTSKTTTTGTATTGTSTTRTISPTTRTETPSTTTRTTTTSKTTPTTSTATTTSTTPSTTTKTTTTTSKTTTTGTATTGSSTTRTISPTTRTETPSTTTRTTTTSKTTPTTSTATTTTPSTSTGTSTTRTATPSTTTRTTTTSKTTPTTSTATTTSTTPSTTTKTTTRTATTTTSTATTRSTTPSTSTGTSTTRTVTSTTRTETPSTTTRSTTTSKTTSTTNTATTTSTTPSTTTETSPSSTVTTSGTSTLSTESFTPTKFNTSTETTKLTTPTVCEKKACPDTEMIDVTFFECLPKVQLSCRLQEFVYDQSLCCFKFRCRVCTTSDGQQHLPGDKWEETCQTCRCKSDATISCKKKRCPKFQVAKCILPGEKAFTFYELNNICCPVSKCFCFPNLCKPPKQCAKGFNPVYSMVGCCLIITCVPKHVCVHNNIDYMPGAIFPSPPGSCTECTCTDTYNSITMQNEAACNPITCNKICAQDEEYQIFTGQCCGVCIKKVCYVTLPNGKTETIQEGKILSFPDMPCMAYSCTREENGTFQVTNVIETCEYSGKSDCAPNQKYERERNKCCGKCVSIGCLLMNGTTVVSVLKENETKTLPNDKCKYYTCKRLGNELIIDITNQICEYYSSKDCGYGQEYFPPSTNECCGHCSQTHCAIVTESGEIKLLTEGQNYTSNDKCISYTCEKLKNEMITVKKIQNCTHTSEQDCEFGQDYVPPSADQCCGYCKQTNCVYVTPSGEKKALKEGEIVIGDKCTNYTCIVIDHQFITVEIKEVCLYKSQNDCAKGYEYVPPGADECCGYCKQTHCVYVTPSGKNELLKEGDTITSDKCTNYTCKVNDHAFITTKKPVTCLHESQNDCELGQSYVAPNIDQCCGFCNQTHCVYVTPDGAIVELEDKEIYQSDDKCTNYTCKIINNDFIITEKQEICRYKSKKDCELGYEYVPPGADQCCGYCNQTHCIYVTPNGENKPLKEGDTITSDDKCTIYTCKVNDHAFVIIEKQETCLHESQNDCELGQTYVAPSAEECCGFCNQTRCVYVTPDGEIGYLEENEIAISYDHCTNYTCKIINNEFITLEQQETCRYRSSKDCKLGYDYVPPRPDQCCGYCNQTHCVYVTPSGKKELLEIGETITSDDKCTNYTCIVKDEEFITLEKQVTCLEKSQKDCALGHTYVPPSADQCCGYCNHTHCGFRTPNGVIVELKENETYKSDDKCTNYTCKVILNEFIIIQKQETCRYKSINDCELGQEYVPPNVDQCCGFCQQTECVYITPNGVIGTLKAGGILIIDKCTTYTCKVIKNVYIIVEKQQICQFNNQNDCKPGETYTDIPGQCCGKCVPKFCVFTDTNGVLQTLAVNKVMKDGKDVCISYTCKEINGQLFTLAMKENCKQPNAQSCAQNEIYIRKPGECCGYCIPILCLIKLPNGQNKTLKVGERFSPDNDNCKTYGCISLYGQLFTVVENKTCEDIRPEDCESGTIEKNASSCCPMCKAPKKCDRAFKDVVLQDGDCKRLESVPFCTGYCKDNVMFDSISMSQESSKYTTCVCCTKVKSHNETVKLPCKKTGNFVLYTYEYIDKCDCTSLKCI